MNGPLAPYAGRLADGIAALGLTLPQAIVDKLLAYGELLLKNSRQGMNALTWGFRRLIETATSDRGRRARRQQQRVGGHGRLHEGDTLRRQVLDDDDGPPRLDDLVDDDAREHLGVADGEVARERYRPGRAPRRLAVYHHRNAVARAAKKRVEREMRPAQRPVRPAPAQSNIKTF